MIYLAQIPSRLHLTSAEHPEAERILRAGSQLITFLSLLV